MGLVTRLVGPNAKGSKLTAPEMDNNLYYLQSLGVSGLTYSSGTLTIENPTGGTLSVTGLTKNLNNQWLISSGNTVEIESFTQKFIYGDLYVSGLLLVDQDAQLIILNGNLILSGGTISGSGQTVLVSLPTFGDLITSGSYSAGTLTLSTSNGTDINVNGFLTGSTNNFYTPTSSGDTSGVVGDLTWDNSYLYIKTNSGWGRINLDYSF